MTHDDDDRPATRALRYRAPAFDAAQEARYQDDLVTFYRPVTLVTVGFVVVFYLLYLGIDALYFGRYGDIGVRLLMLGIATPAAIIGILSSWVLKSTRATRVLVFGATIINGLCQVVSYELSRQAGVPIPYEGMIILMCFAYFMLGMDYRHALVLALIVAGLHVLVSRIGGMPAPMLFDHALMMTSVIVIGTMSGYLQDVFSRRNWLNEDRLRQLAERDPLTDLYNRRQFEQRLAGRLRRAQRGDLGGFSVLMVDIDHFKRINDNHGHDAGDAVLRAVSALLTATLRVDDHAFRIGGEEFLVMLVEHDLDAVHACAERIRRGAEALRIRHGAVELPPITLSIGIARFPDDGSSGLELVQRADAALYAAKRSGRNRVMPEAA